MDSGATIGLEIVVTIAALMVVLVLAWFAIRMLARMAGAQRAGARVRVLESTPVGQRERIVLLRFDNHDYLLGVTSGGIRMLDRTTTSPGEPTDRRD